MDPIKEAMIREEDTGESRWPTRRLKSAVDPRPDMTPAEAIQFLGDAAKYFEARPTKGEDMAHWSNVYNAENCLKVADLIRKHITVDAM